MKFNLINHDYHYPLGTDYCSVAIKCYQLAVICSLNYDSAHVGLFLLAVQSWSINWPDSVICRLVTWPYRAQHWTPLRLTWRSTSQRTSMTRLSPSRTLALAWLRTSSWITWEPLLAQALRSVCIMVIPGGTKFIVKNIYFGNNSWPLVAKFTVTKWWENTVCLLNFNNV